MKIQNCLGAYDAMKACGQKPWFIYVEDLLIPNFGSTREVPDKSGNLNLGNP